jgi:hypothetical protein
MPVLTEPERIGNPIVTSREPVGPKNAASKGSPGDVALMDAVTIVVIAWAITFLLMFSLRRH